MAFGTEGGYSPWPNQAGGGAGSTVPAANPYQNIANTPAPGSEASLMDRAQDIADEERSRYDSGLGYLTEANDTFQREMNNPLDADLLFSRASDTIGARSKASMEGLRRSLGARGISPNSGAAQGMLSRMMFQDQGARIGAKRDIAIENKRQRQVNAATNFANAMNIAGYQTQPVSGVMLETEQNIFEGNLAREGLAAQAASQRSANKTNTLGALIGGGASVLAALI